MFGFGAGRKIQPLRDALNKAHARIGELEKQYNTIRAVPESMVEGVIIVDRDTRIVSINPSIEEIFGVSKKDAQGRFFLEVFRNNDISEIINTVLKNKEAVSKELDLLWPVEKIFQVNASSILENNVISGCLLVIHDISEIRKLEKIRSDFVANVSHELRTPLTSIKGFVETLLEGALDDKENSRHFLEIIQAHAERLNNLINDLLDLSRLEHGKIKLKPEELNLRYLIDEILSGFKSQLDKKNIEARNDLASGLSVAGDKNRIEQVLTNLVDNAIKFNRDKGFISISGREADGKIKITVEDSGIGIPERDIPRIFERFYRIDKARSRELGGTGLGLSIVKHIVELHGGQTGVESAEGIGSKFWFTLPKS